MPEPRSLTAAKEERLPPSVLRERFDYEPASGRLVWRPKPETGQGDQRYIRRWNTIHAGKVAGSERVDGTRHVRTVWVNDMSVYEHRAVWAYAYGAWPKFSIDHIDGDPINNIEDAIASRKQAQASAGFHPNHGRAA